MAYAYLLIDRIGQVARVALNRPKANALSVDLIRELDRAFADLEADGEVRCVVLTSALDRIFCGGADIPSLQEALGRPSDDNALLSEGIRLMDRIEACPKPVVAAVGGLALGGGCELALACHLRVAADSARFALPELTLGIVPGWGGTHRLPRMVGEARALEWMLTGRMVPAEEAKEAGLLVRVVPAADLSQAAQTLAETLAGRPPVAMRGILRAVRERALDPARGAALETAAMREAVMSKDAVEGVTAFLEKRTPRFVGE